MRKYFPTYEEAVSHIWICNCSILNFLIYEENLIFFFISVDDLSDKSQTRHVLYLGHRGNFWGIKHWYWGELLEASNHWTEQSRIISITGRKQCFGSIRIHRIRMLLGFLDPDLDPLVSGTDTDPDPYHQAKKVRKTLIPIVLWLLYDFYLEKWIKCSFNK
jgi:hypothetical protein